MNFDSRRFATAPVLETLDITLNESGRISSGTALARLGRDVQCEPNTNRSGRDAPRDRVTHHRVCAVGFPLFTRQRIDSCGRRNNVGRGLIDGWRYIDGSAGMNAATKAFVIRWSIPLAVGYGLLAWGLVLIWLERRREKSKRSSSRDH